MLMLLHETVVFVIGCVTVGGLAPHTAAEPCPLLSQAGNLLSLERLGAGAPAGWLVDGDGFVWEAERRPGPLGVGAARIQFQGKGSLLVTSPARAMAGGASHAAALWLRSEPAGVAVRVEVRDNDTQSPALAGTVTASDTWKLKSIRGDLDQAVRGHYYLTLATGGQDCTLWLDGLHVGECAERPTEGWRPETLPAGVVLEPIMPWGVSAGDEGLGIKARVVGVTQQGCRLRLRAVQTNGTAADLPAIPLDDSGVWKGDFEVTGEIARLYGMVRVEATVVDTDGEALSPMSETLLAHVPQPVPGPLRMSPFGIHVRLREPDVAVVAKLGYKWCRTHDADTSTKWGYAEPEAGKWVWFDDRISLARRMQSMSVCEKALESKLITMMSLGSIFISSGTSASHVPRIKAPLSWMDSIRG